MSLYLSEHREISVDNRFTYHCVSTIVKTDAPLKHDDVLGTVLSRLRYPVDLVL